MHQIFQTDEILRLIISHLANPQNRYTITSWSRGGPHTISTSVVTWSPPFLGTLPYQQVLPIGTLERRTVARLARVCRTWEEAALDALWREIPSVEPLFGLFPPSCLSGAHRHENVQFTRPLVPSDWVRFRYYAPRVQRITPLDARWTRWTVDFKAFLSLSHFHPGGPILPNLQQWAWDTQRGAGDIVGGMCFLSPSVTSIEVTLGHTTSADTLFGFLYNLPMRCPHLTSLALSYNDKDWPDWGLEATMTALQSIFSLLPKLTRLSLPFFMDQPTFITRVGSIPGLKELMSVCPDKLVGAFVDDDSDELDDETIAPESMLFHDLRSVTLQSTMNSCFRFLRRFVSKNIINMYITTLHLRSPTQLSECVAIIASSCPHLRVLHLQYTPAQHDMSFDTSWFKLNTLAPCGDLEELTIGHPRVAPWTDDEVLEAVRCWPRLRVLRLNPRPTRALFEPKLTLRTLWNLVKWCRRLEVVRFYVDTSEIPSLAELAQKDVGFETPDGSEPSSSAAVESEQMKKLALFSPVLASALASNSALGSGTDLGVAKIKGSNILTLLDFGHSQRCSESSTQELATYIATLCPYAQVQGSEQWREVATILKVNQATRLEDQKKIEALRKEVERLMALLDRKSVV